MEGPRPEQLGSVAALSPMKTPSRMRGALGADQASSCAAPETPTLLVFCPKLSWTNLCTRSSFCMTATPLHCTCKRGASAACCIASRSCMLVDVQVVVTPVRRSARNSVASQALPSSVLRQSGYSYVPNNYLESRLGKEVVIGPPEAFRAFLEVRREIAHAYPI